RAAQLRRRDHLHGRGDLLRRLHAVDAGAEGFETGHLDHFLPLPLREGVGGRGSQRKGLRVRYWHQPLLPTPSRKGRGSYAGASRHHANVLTKPSRKAVSFLSVSVLISRSVRIA